MPASSSCGCAAPAARISTATEAGCTRLPSYAFLWVIDFGFLRRWAGIHHPLLRRLLLILSSPQLIQKHLIIPISFAFISPRADLTGSSRSPVLCTARAGSVQRSDWRCVSATGVPQPHGIPSPLALDKRVPDALLSSRTGSFHRSLQVNAGLGIVSVRCGRATGSGLHHSESSLPSLKRARVRDAVCGTWP